MERETKGRDPLWTILSAGMVTQRAVCPDLPVIAAGLPKVTEAPCEGTECRQCAEACPTQAITISIDCAGGVVALDRGLCIGCAACVETCPSGTLAPDLSTRTAVRTREELVLGNRPAADEQGGPAAENQRRGIARRGGRDRTAPFLRSLHIREVSTGCSATDLEVAAINNPIFDVARFGVHFVASPRFADALLVTGPVGQAMQEPLRRCFDAMAEPRLVIAAGTCAISGGVHRGGYAHANGVAEILPVATFIPGCPPHPWSIIHGILLAMGRDRE